MDSANNVQKQAGEVYEQYRWFLQKICKRFVGQAVELDDLMQMAYFGVVSALSSYDETTGAKFATHLASHVQWKLCRELSHSGFMLPAHIKSSLKKIDKARNSLAAELGRKPTTGELSSYIGISQNRIMLYDIDKTRASIVSLDKPIGENDETSIVDLLEDANAQDDFEGVEYAELAACLWQQVEHCVSEREYCVIRERYANNKTIDEAAALLDMPHSTVKYDGKNAINKLRKDRKIRLLAEDFGYVYKLRHVTLTEYKYTHTSAVEQELIDKEDYVEYIAELRQRRLEQQTAGV